MAEILRRSAAEYVKQYPRQAAPQVQSTLAKLSLCRTPALGGRKHRCQQCDHECVIYNSCVDRHCPTCAGAKRADWFDATAGLILDGVNYFQVVFTLPDVLSGLALGNRRVIYNLLFRTAWTALRRTIEAEQGYEAAALMVLHTWNQKLHPHGHVHAVVPGGGPALDGSGWRVAMREDDPHSIGHYLVDADELRRVYRDTFLRRLERLRTRGELKLEGDYQYLQDHEAWQQLLERLRHTKWVSHIEPPPQVNCGPAQVLKYLARYLTGGPIADRRIVSADEREVTWLAREGTTPGGEAKQVPVTTSLVEFTRRWSLHILPKGFTKTRRYGGWCNTRCAAYLELCSKQLEAIETLLSPGATDFCPFEAEATETDQGWERCPHCGSLMNPQEVMIKPSWHATMNSPWRPPWYHPPKRLPPAVITA